jgi:Tol biopolymer transport system component
LIKESQVVGLVTGLVGPYGRAELATGVQDFLEGYGFKPAPKSAAKSAAIQSLLGNTRIAFVTWVTDLGGALDVINADGAKTRLVDPNDLHVVDESPPSWSPDGTKIAFWGAHYGAYNIYVMNADGTNPKRLTKHESSRSRDTALAPSWSPDGKRIVFEDRANSGIYVMNADGTNPTRLTDRSQDSSPSWSPDGKKIAFSSSRNDKNREIYVMNADGTNPTNLTNHLAWDESPSWSPDGKKIAFSSFRDDNWEIYVMNADGTNPTNLTNHLAWDESPSWSPD